ncbi:sensor histidine kinase [Aquimarina intermedia]|uniref:histidine kinase n=1 Tax=Aquimarina intermedia TaxID=350814 RepID=A0A5S5C0Z9_9FLAO|nr:sensor histidine kinase [Aquimarina intermedia]TYP71633.1 phospho-acceptor domain-containing protein [Aquimarina intermedia]
MDQNNDGVSILKSIYVSLFILILIVAGIFFLVAAIKNSQKWLVHTVDVKHKTERLHSFIKDAERGQRGYLLTNETSYNKPYNKATDQLDDQIEELKAETAYNPAQQANIKKLDSLLYLKLDILERTIDAQKAGNDDTALNIVNTDRGQYLMREINTVIQNILKDQDTLFEERKQTQLYTYYLAIALLIACLGYMILNLLRIRNQLRPLIEKLKNNNESLQQSVDAKNEEIRLREIQEAINKTLIDRLQDKNKELNQFAYIASHDLQEPLRTVDNFITIFEEDYGDKLDEEASAYFNFIYGATERMKNLITGLLNYSRIGRSGKIEAVDLNIILNDIIIDYTSLLEASDAQLKLPKLPTVNGYEIEIKQLFSNLISNAIKFIPEDRQPTIEIKYTEDQMYHIFEIHDNGIGIKPAHINKIFEMFTRLHSTSQYEGKGIGLSFCKKIVELHEGTIKAESELGVGSIFKFTFKKDLQP